MMKQFEDKVHKVKIGLAEMLKGGVIMDVTSAEQAIIAPLPSFGTAETGIRRNTCSYHARPITHSGR